MNNSHTMDYFSKQWRDNFQHNNDTVYVDAFTMTAINVHTYRLFSP